MMMSYANACAKLIKVIKNSDQLTYKAQNVISILSKEINLDKT